MNKDCQLIFENYKKSKETIRDVSNIIRRDSDGFWMDNLQGSSISPRDGLVKFQWENKWYIGTVGLGGGRTYHDISNVHPMDITSINSITNILDI